MAKNGADKQEKNSIDILWPTHFSINSMVFQEMKQNLPNAPEVQPYAYIS